MRLVDRLYGESRFAVLWVRRALARDRVRGGSISRSPSTGVCWERERGNDLRGSTHLLLDARSPGAFGVQF